MEHMLGSLHKSDNEFEEVNVNIKFVRPKTTSVFAGKQLKVKVKLKPGVLLVTSEAVFVILN